MRKSQGKITDSQNQTNNEIRRGRHNYIHVYPNLQTHLSVF